MYKWSEFLKGFGPLPDVIKNVQETLFAPYAFPTHTHVLSCTTTHITTTTSQMVPWLLVFEGGRIVVGGPTGRNIFDPIQSLEWRVLCIGICAGASQDPPYPHSKRSTRRVPHRRGRRCTTQGLPFPERNRATLQHAPHHSLHLRFASRKVTILSLYFSYFSLFLSLFLR